MFFASGQNNFGAITVFLGCVVAHPRVSAIYCSILSVRWAPLINCQDFSGHRGFINFGAIR
jgi:hypothetical protein